jgi:hypothetical protein
LDGGGDEERGAGEAGHGEDVGDVVHHHVHACQLGPDLSEDADVCPVDHIGLEELEVRDVGVLPFKFDLVADLFELRDHKGCVRIAFAVDEGEDVVRVVPAVLAAKPTGRLGQEDHTAEEDYCRDHLEAPRDTEGSGTFKERAPVLQDREHRKGLSCWEWVAYGNVEHDHDAPCDCPLLGSDQATTLRGWSQL